MPLPEVDKMVGDKVSEILSGLDHKQIPNKMGVAFLSCVRKEVSSKLDSIQEVLFLPNGTALIRVVVHEVQYSRIAINNLNQLDQCLLYLSDSVKERFFKTNLEYKPKGAFLIHTSCNDRQGSANVTPMWFKTVSLDCPMLKKETLCYFDQPWLIENMLLSEDFVFASTGFTKKLRPTFVNKKGQLLSPTENRSCLWCDTEYFVGSMIIWSCGHVICVKCNRNLSQTNPTC